MAERIKTLIPDPSSPAWTVLDDEYFASRDWVPPAPALPDGTPAPVVIPPPPPPPVNVVVEHEEIGSNPNAFTIPANVPVQVLNRNLRRRGLVLQNLDAANILFYSFDVIADVNTSLQIQPGGAVLLDFTTPTGPLWVIAAGSLKFLCNEFTAIAS